MRCDVVAVGTELLLGQIVNSNAAWLGERLAGAGIGSLSHVVVGDNVGRIATALRRALEDADAVIVCGGLGPTHDDVTREAIAEVMGVGLHRDDDVADRIGELFASRKRPMPENNLRQAMVPEGASVIAQVMGTAPGLICPVGADRVIYAVPGVPRELYEMVDRGVLPDLVARSGHEGVIASRVLKCWGDSESGLNARLADVIALLDDEGDPTLAFLARGWEGLEVRLTTRADDAAAAAATLDRWEALVRRELGPIVFSSDGRSMEQVVLDGLGARGLSLATAESVTGGLVAARLTSVAGSSAVFRGAIVSYASDVKFDVLGVTAGPVVHEGAAAEMAAGVRRVLGADVGLSLTGVAGPEPQDDQPAGTLCIGLSSPDGSRTLITRLPGDRTIMRELSVISALDVVRRFLDLR